MNRVSIARDALETLQKHLLAAYPHEGCGVLIGRNSDKATLDVTRAAGTRNAEKIRGHDRFSIEPLDYLHIERDMDKARTGLKIVGFFHSHPDAPATPSATDLEMAQGLFDVTQEHFVYSITSIHGASIGNTSYWRLNADATKFEALNAFFGE